MMVIPGGGGGLVPRTISPVVESPRFGLQEAWVHAFCQAVRLCTHVPCVVNGCTVRL